VGTEQKINRVKKLDLSAAEKELIIKTINDKVGCWGTGIFDVEGKFLNTPKEIKSMMELICELVNKTSLKETDKAISKFASYNFLGFQSGIMSNLFYCLHPTKYPVINGGIKEPFQKLMGIELTGFLNNYLAERDILTNIRTTFGFKDDFRDIDAFFAGFAGSRSDSDNLYKWQEETKKRIEEEQNISDVAKQPDKIASIQEHEGTKDDVHLKIQYMLVKIGLLDGYDVWIASNDVNKEFNGERFNEMCLDILPHFAGETVLNIAKNIDVIWFKRGSARPERFFEIEHTTSIYSGLLRLNDVMIDYPIPAAYIVGSNDKKSKFNDQLNRRTFVNNGLNKVCKFLDYEDVEKNYEVTMQKKDVTL